MVVVSPADYDSVVVPVDQLPYGIDCSINRNIVAVLFHYDIPFADVELLVREGFLQKKSFKEADPGGSTEQRELFKEGVLDVMEGAGLPLRRRRMTRAFRRVVSKEPFAAIVAAPHQASHQASHLASHQAKKLKTGTSSLVAPPSSASTSSASSSSASSSSAVVQGASSSGAVVSGVKAGVSSSSVAKKSVSSSGAKKAAKPADSSDSDDSDDDGDDDEVTVLSSGSGHRDSLNSLFNDVSNEVGLMIELWVVLSGAVALALWP